ncbi:fungal-specific transcription factor domain-containing protein [Dendryphion nanum]|uniref:Fungal-specific transcription factor domain-containing protein n=1 Tax=Dendryphion nanum TaxID=256645 RepID=A0A9P9E4Q1_9PLEO|nr:fungal-specific transcription factor domain-containing protein [Dendryphion nanum]
MVPTNNMSSASPDTLTPHSPHAPIQKGFSCVLCAQRKVKCDKAPGGCLNCTKSRISCVYKAPPPPRRRRKGVRELDVHTKLRLYEDALRKLGVDPDDVQNQELGKIKAHKNPSLHKDLQQKTLPEDLVGHQDNSDDATDPGVLVSSDGKSRYLENGMWTSLKGEFRDSKEFLDSSDEEPEQYEVPQPETFSTNGPNLLFGSPKPGVSLRTLHPRGVQIFKLWQVYIDNVNPVVKVFHAPTVQQIILNASDELDDVPRNVEALMFAIYCLAVTSLSDTDCEAILGQSKATAVPRFRAGAQQALINAGFLKSSNLMILQALVLYLLSLQSYDARIVWIFTGIASRIGQRIGLHRDGVTLGLPPFEIEIRRRLWWQILFLEGLTEKLAGTGSNIFSGDTKQPCNVNDNDLYPHMKELPKEHEGPTEMMLFLIRTHVGLFLRNAHTPKSNFDGNWSKLTSATTAMDAKEKAISDLETTFHQRYVRHCDPSIPWHFMCLHMAKAIISMMRFIAHNPESSSTSSSPSSQAEKATLFTLALQVTTFQNYVYTLPTLRGFTWHVNLSFQWRAFIFLVSELRFRTARTEETEQAWKEVQTVFECHPSFGRAAARKAFSVAIGNLVLRAWEVWASGNGLGRERQGEEEPGFIGVLRERRGLGGASTVTNDAKPWSFSSREQFLDSMPDAANHHILPTLSEESFIQPTDSLPSESFSLDQDFASSLGPPSFPDPLITEPEDMDWNAWNDLLVDFQTDGMGSGVADFGHGGM